MATVMAPPEPPREGALQADGPQQGVIADARRRQRRRRTGISCALAAVLVAGGLIAFGGGGGGTHRPGVAVRGPRAGTGTRFRVPRLRDMRLIPALQGGSVGWGVAFGGGEGGGLLPTPHTPVFVKFFGYTPQGVWDTVAVTTPRVAMIAVDHVQARTRDIGLPYGFRVARLRIPAAPSRDRVAPIAPPGPGVAPTAGPPPLIALDGHGHRIAQQMPLGNHLPTEYWQSPGHVPAGPCRITATPLPGLSAQWGHVAKHIRAFSDIVGRAFESCVDTEFYLHKWPLDAAILLDAGHPGRPPAPIPNMTRVAGTPDTYGAPGAYPGNDMTATRLPNAWLVVAGGSGPAQRLTLLRHLQAKLSLN